MLREGVWVAEGGVRAIPAAFFRLAVELGVEFRFGAEVVATETDSSSLTSVRLSSGESVSADKFIV
ncbi:FAD-dependent oxidoreductase, partial [Acinetobacter baumannii]